MRRLMNSKYICKSPGCNRVFLEKDKLEKHESKPHISQKEEEYINERFKKAISKFPYKCSYENCLYVFNQKSFLDRHEERHKKGILRVRPQVK